MIMSKVLDYLLSGIFWFLSKLPLRFLYILSYVVRFLMYTLIGYRKKVVRGNLTNAFPELTEKERRKIERDFYLYLCDSFFESIKLLDMTREDIAQRITFKNPELIDGFLGQGRSVVLCLGHYGNWEWIPSLTLYQKEECVAVQLYRPLNNKFFDRFYLKIRQKWGSVGVPKADTLRAIRNIKESGKPFFMGFMADQTPSVGNIHYWTTFLNQETPVLIGPEKISKKGDYAVVYLDITHVKRGCYSGEYVLITDKPKEEAPFYITETYTRMMENTIRRSPAYWLWSHKRWKHKKA
ncbi:MAG: lysophospholipid acyltransferase family protein [Bacteroidales bacterium]